MKKLQKMLIRVAELQTLYGLSLFPDQNTAQEMLIQIVDVLDMDWREKSVSLLVAA